MSNFLAYGRIENPNQGSRNQTEYLKILKDTDDQALQTLVNDYLNYLSGPQVLNRPSIRNIQFSVATNGTLYAAIHFVLVGDDTTPPNL